MTESSILNAVVVGAAVVLVVFLLDAIRKQGTGKGIPGPLFHIPLIGETIQFYVDPPRFMFSRFKRYNSPIFRAALFGQEVVVVGDPEIKRGPLGDDECSVTVLPIPTLAALIDLDYAQSTDRHKLFRKCQNNAFAPRVLLSKFPGFLDEVTRSVDDILADDKPVDINAKVRRLVTRIALRVVLDLKMPGDKYKEAVEHAIILQNGVFGAPVKLPGFSWYEAVKNRPAYKALMADFIRATFKVDGDVVKPPQGDTPSMISALIEELTAAEGEAKVDSVADRSIGVVFASTETTAGLMMASILVAAMAPHSMENLRREQADLLAMHCTEITYDTVNNKMPYLDAFVKETARLFPPAHVSFRKPVKDVEVCGHLVPKGTTVMLSYDLMNCRDYEDEPLSQGLPAPVDYNNALKSFKPERWMDDATKPSRPHTFSFGSFMCLGMAVSYLEVKLVLATLIRRTTWEILNKNPQVGFAPSIRLKNGTAMLQFTHTPLY